MSLDYSIDKLIQNYSGSNLENDIVIDLKVLNEATTFFESEIKNHCRFTISGKEISVEQNIQGEPEHKPSIVVYSKENIAIKVLDGDLDPLQAFFSGELRMEGDTKLAIEIAKLVA